MNIKILTADYADPLHSRDLVMLLDSYANDPIGGGEALGSYAQENLVNKLSDIPGAFSILCYVDGEPAGFANCFEAFSTFKCMPLINIHDIAVRKEYRGHRLSQMILEKIELIAKERQCCKITLEVLDGNRVAQNAYLKYGFQAYELDSEFGKAQFWHKEI